MTAVWRTPRTWSNNELVNETIMNEHVRDNLDWLKTPPQGIYTLPNLVVTTTVMADLPSVTFTFTSAGGAFLAGFQGQSIMPGNTVTQYFDILCDGVSIGGSNGVAEFQGIVAGGPVNVSFVCFVAAKAAGSHIWKLQSRVSGSSCTLVGSTGNFLSQFWVREVG